MMKKIKEFESRIMKYIHILLNSHRALFLSHCITYSAPEIKVINSNELHYESEFVIYFYRGDKFLDVLECRIIREGKAIANVEEFESWIESEMKNIFNDLLP